MKPIKKQSGSLPKLDLPFDIEQREQALKQRLKDVYFIKVVEKDFIYKKFDRYHENSDTGIQFLYKLEVVIAKSPILKSSSKRRRLQRGLGLLLKNNPEIDKMITEKFNKKFSSSFSSRDRILKLTY